MEEALRNFNVGSRSDKIYTELRKLEKNKDYKPKKGIIEDSKGLIRDMSFAFGLELDNTKKRWFYGGLFFGIIRGEIGSATRMMSIYQNTKRRVNSEKEIKKRVSLAEKTMNNILLGKRPTKKEFNCAIDLFDYVSEELSKPPNNYQKEPQFVGSTHISLPRLSPNNPFIFK